MTDIEVRTSGTEVSASASDRILIRLPENATTGYQWSITNVSELLDVESNEFFTPGQIVPGAAGERQVIVRPRGAGKGRLALDLKRQWEREPIEHFEVEVQVTA
jgi:inhibitor of cysteine peptidase